VAIGSSFGPETHTLAERVGHDENVGEQDGRVETEAADRLQRRFHGQSGRVAEVDERLRRGADLAIFGQVASRLSHQPDRGNALPLAGERGEKGLFGRGGGGGHFASSILSGERDRQKRNFA